MFIFVFFNCQLHRLFLNDLQKFMLQIQVCILTKKYAKLLKVLGNRDPRIFYVTTTQVIDKILKTSFADYFFKYAD